MSEQSKLMQMLDITRHSAKESSLVKEWGEAYHEILSSSYGFRLGDTGEVIGHIARDTKQHDLGSFTNIRGETSNLVFSIAESRKRWMERQDVTLSGVFSNQNGLAYTQDIEKAIYSLLTPEDKEFAKAQLNLYYSINTQIDEVYRDIHSISFFSSLLLVNNPDQHSPILLANFTPQGRGGAGFRFLHAEVLARLKILNQKNTGDIVVLEQSTDTDVLFNYFKHAAHFIAWEKQLREWSYLFAGKDFTDAITTKYGDNFLNTMRSILNDITEGRKVRETTLWTAKRKSE